MTRHIVRPYTWQHMAIAGMLSYIAAVLSIVWAQMFIVPPADRAPLEWVYDEGLPTTPLCPGDEVPIRVAMRIDAPGGLYSYSVIRRAPNHPAVQAVSATELAQIIVSKEHLPIVGDTVAGAANVFRSAFSPDEIPALVVDLDNVFVVPDLPPGPYERITVAGLDGRNAEQQIRMATFTVAEDCP